MSKKFLSPIKLAQGATNPSTGSAGELFYNTGDSKIYTHNGTIWLAAGGGVTNSATAPENPANGDAWFNTNEGRLFVYYADGTSSQWVEATPTPVSSENYQMPAGAIMAWGAAAAPTNWLLCDGSAVSRTTYASLFASIGTSYGTGDGSTTFNLPNLKGRVVVGRDSAQTEFDTLGETGGAKTHTLILAEMPSHTHGTVAHSHTFSGTTSTNGNHIHPGMNQTYSNGGTTNSSVNRDSGGSANYISSYAGDHSHTYSGTTSNSAPDTQSAGSGSAHNNLQPYIVLNYIIKFSAGETPGDSQLAGRVGVLETQNNATPLSQNYIINGAFDIWQRGTSVSITADGSFSADRWVTYYNGSGATRTVSRQAFTPGAAPVAGYEGTYFLRFAQSVAGSGASFTSLGQRIEDVRTLAGQTVTVSFWAKAASTITIPNMTFWQRFGDGGSSNVGTDFGSSLSIGTSWSRYSFTVNLPSISGKTIGANSYLHFEMYQPVNQTFTLDLWGVQVEAGSYATPFRRNSPNPQAELAACQRYYYRVTSDNSYGWFGTATGNGSNAWLPIPFPVTMRTVPSSTVEWSGSLSGINFLLGGTPTSFVYAGDGLTTKCATLTFSGSGFPAATLVRSNNNSNVYFGFSAEL